jgi:hypothetical protein
VQKITDDFEKRKYFCKRRLYLGDIAPEQTNKHEQKQRRLIENLNTIVARENMVNMNATNTKWRQDIPGEENNPY